jgi:hypothetical protein
MTITEIGVIVASVNGLVATALATSQLIDHWTRRARKGVEHAPAPREADRESNGQTSRPNRAPISAFANVRYSPRDSLADPRARCGRESAQG